ncbi:MAG TPA: tripartite tricarboxylate transporter substrate-binding protein [Bradyrhizobium sp.]
MAERMQGPLGQPVIVENVTGAAGNIGVGRVARAAPDGYTLVAGIWSTHVVNAAIYTLPYDVLNDFEPILLTSRNAQIIVARKTVPADDLKGLIAWLKANPDMAAVGTSGVGSPQHVFAVLFQNTTGTHFWFVPYRGGVVAMQDLIAGRIDLIFADQTTSLPQVRSGSIKAYAVTGNSRLAAAPDIPTVDEAGLPGFYCSVWSAVCSQGYAQGCHRQAQRRRGQRVGRTGGAPTGRRGGAADRAARRADTGGARRAAKGRDREVVADHQGGRHQGRITGLSG